MITADEARKKTEEYIKSCKKISAMLTYLNDEIVVASEEGKSSVYVTEKQIKHLSIKERERFTKKLQNLGYKVEAVYEPHNINISIPKGFEITW